MDNLLVVMNVDIDGEGRSGVVHIHANDDPYVLAQAFIAEHGLDEEVLPALTEHIASNKQLAEDALPEEEENEEAAQLDAMPQRSGTLGSSQRYRASDDNGAGDDSRLSALGQMLSPDVQLQREAPIERLVASTKSSNSKYPAEALSFTKGSGGSSNSGRKHPQSSANDVTANTEDDSDLDGLAVALATLGSSHHGSPSKGGDRLSSASNRHRDLETVAYLNALGNTGYGHGTANEGGYDYGYGGYGDGYGYDNDMRRSVDDEDGDNGEQRSAGSTAPDSLVEHEQFVAGHIRAASDDIDIAHEEMLRHQQAAQQIRTSPQQQQPHPRQPQQPASAQSSRTAAAAAAGQSFSQSSSSLSSSSALRPAAPQPVHDANDDEDDDAAAEAEYAAMERRMRASVGATVHHGVQSVRPPSAAGYSSSSSSAALAASMGRTNGSSAAAGGSRNRASAGSAAGVSGRALQAARPPAAPSSSTNNAAAGAAKKQHSAAAAAALAARLSVPTAATSAKYTAQTKAAAAAQQQREQYAAQHSVPVNPALYDRLHSEAEERAAKLKDMAKKAAEAEAALLKQEHRQLVSGSLAYMQSNGVVVQDTSNRPSDASNRLYNDAKESQARREALAAEVRAQVESRQPWTCALCGAENVGTADACANTLKFGKATSGSSGNAGAAAVVCGAPRPVEGRPLISAAAQRIVRPAGSDFDSYVRLQIERYIAEKREREELAQRQEDAKLAADFPFKPSINAASEELARRRRNKLMQQEQSSSLSSAPASNTVDALYDDARRRREALERAMLKAAKEHPFQPDIGVNALRPLPEDREAARSHVASRPNTEAAIEEARKKAFFERLYSEAARARVRIEQTRRRLIEAEKEAAQLGIVHKRSQGNRASSKSRSLSSGRGSEQQPGTDTDNDGSEDSPSHHVGPILHASFKDVAAARRKAEEEYEAAIAADASRKHMSSGSARILAQMRARAFAGIYELLLQSQKMTAAQREEELAAQEAVEAAMRAMGEGGSTVDAAEALASVFAAGVATRGRSTSARGLGSSGGAMPASPAAISDANNTSGIGANGALQPLRRLAPEELAALLAVVDAHQQTASSSSSSSGAGVLLLEGLVSRLSRQTLDLELAWSGVLDPSLAVYVKRALQMLKLRLYPASTTNAAGATTAGNKGKASPVSFSQFCEALGRILEEVGGGSHIYLLARKEADAKALAAAAAAADQATADEDEAAAIRAQRARAAKEALDRQRAIDAMPTHERPDPEATFNPVINPNSAAIASKLRGPAAAAAGATSNVTTGRSSSSSASSGPSARPSERLSKAAAQDHEVRRRALEIQRAREEMLAHPYKPIPYGTTYDPKAAMMMTSMQGAGAGGADAPLAMPPSRTNLVQLQLSKPIASSSSSSTTSQTLQQQQLRQESEELAAVAKRVLARSNELASKRGTQQPSSEQTAAAPAPAAVSQTAISARSAHQPSSSSSSSNAFLSPPPAYRQAGVGAAGAAGQMDYGYPPTAAQPPRSARKDGSPGNNAGGAAASAVKRSPIQELQHLQALGAAAAHSSASSSSLSSASLLAAHEAEEAAIVPAVRERLLKQLSSINMGELEARIDRILSVDPSSDASHQASAASRGRKSANSASMVGGGAPGLGGGSESARALARALGRMPEGTPPTPGMSSVGLGSARKAGLGASGMVVAPSVTKALFSSSQVRQ